MTAFLLPKGIKKTAEKHGGFITRPHLSTHQQISAVFNMFRRVFCGPEGKQAQYGFVGLYID